MPIISFDEAVIEDNTDSLALSNASLVVFASRIVVSFGCVDAVELQKPDVRPVGSVLE